MALSPAIQTINMRFVSRVELPVVGRGTIATKASVVILGNGQIGFSTIASKALGVPKVAISFNEKSREVYVVGATPTNIKKYKLQEDLLFPMKVGKKSGTYSFAGSGLLKSREVFANELYDYKGSGNQVFEASENEKENMVIFNLPMGAIAKRVIAPRKPRAKKVEGQTANGVNGGLVAGHQAPEDALQLGDPT